MNTAPAPNATLLKLIWSEIYAQGCDVNNVFSRYFHDDYTQCINGEVMNRAEYYAHVVAQHKTMQINHIDYKYILEDNNELFALYYPRGVNQHGDTVLAEVLVYCQFLGAKLIHIHGQVRLIEGQPADADMKG